MHDPAVRRTLKLMVPITVGLGLINFNAFVNTIFAARLLDKYQAPSSINAAFRLYIFPQGMFRSRSRPCCSRRSPGSSRGRTWTASAPWSRPASGRSRSC